MISVTENEDDVSTEEDDVAAEELELPDEFSFFAQEINNRLKQQEYKINLCISLIFLLTFVLSD